MAIIFGFITAPFLLFLIFLLTDVNLFKFWDYTSMLFVLLSTIFITTVTYRFERVLVLFTLFLKRVNGQHRRHYQETVVTILNLSRAKKESYQKFVQIRNQIKDPFLKDVAQLIDWEEGGVSHQQLQELLQLKADTFYRRYTAEVYIFKQFANMPFIFGIMGTSINLTAYFINHQNSTFNFPEFGHCLLSVLYGFILSFFFLIPIAKNLKDSTFEDKISRQIAVEGILMIQQKFATKFIEEKILSYLLPNERQLFLKKE